ncbi:MAG TPA: 23S rRNA (uracil(1939)-C(5))-methyltransferase RlmD [Abditibacteriaceae bacterium]
MQHPPASTQVSLAKVRFGNVAAGGDVVGRDEEGRAVFVPYAAPGDEAVVAITQQNKSFARGQMVQLLHVSPERVAPPCPFYRPPVDESSHAVSPSWQPRQSCGGCQIQHLSYVTQLQAKRGIVVQALQRIGGLGEAGENLVAECVPSPQPFHYRNKAEFVVTPDLDAHSSGSPSHTWRAGFLAPESHHAVDVTHCPIQQDKNNNLLTALREALQDGLATPYHEQSGTGVLKRVVARTSSQGESLAVAEATGAPWPEQHEFAARLQRLPHVVGVLRRSTDGSGTTLETLAGRDWLEEELCGLRLRVAGEGFFQINSALTPVLVETALRLAQLEPGHRVLDLFCGVGLFTLAVAQRGAVVSGVEANGAAVISARENAQRNQLDAKFYEGDAARTMQRRQFAGARWDVVLLDPPRAGAATCVPPLLRLRPRRIVYVSCDPATLARDVKLLCKGGYVLRQAVPLDMFPQTAHVETVAQLELDTN